MRPRVFPAEDPRRPGWPRARRSCFNEAAGIPRGRRKDSTALALRLAASMRPRVFPAEDQCSPHRTCAETGASMRPRVFPAEDFHAVQHGPRPGAASMRPRVFPAEDTRAGRAPLPMRFSFNEAAGIPRGRLLGWVETAVAWIPLQ